MTPFFSHHQKSPEIPPFARAKYPWLSHRKLSDESVEARYYLIEYLSEAFGFPGELEQDASGKPLPILIPWHRPRYWSVSHSENYVAGIVSIHPTGIDIAEFSERHISLLNTHSDAEYHLLGTKNWRNFYRLWTGKEAIIKKVWAKLDDMGDISFCRFLNNLDYFFEFRNELHNIRFESNDTIILAYTAP